MKSFAIVSSGKVTNVIVANSLEDAELVADGQLVEITDGQIAPGWNFDEQGNFSAPVSPEIVTPTGEEISAE